MEIVKLKTNHIENPIGYEFAYLHLSWNVIETQDKTDEWTRVLISKDPELHDILIDTGKMQSYGKPYFDAKPELMPRTRYYWKVIIKGESETAESETAFFETAKMKEPWQADFIGIKNSGSAMPFIYRSIHICKKVKRAVLYSMGHGLYEPYLDEKHIGTEYLLPGYHSYDLMCEYQTFDLTDDLKKGDHVIGFLLGEGWYKGRFVFEGGYKNLYGDRQKVIGELHITYEDDSEELICTDCSWKAKESVVYENGIYDGEVINYKEKKKELEVKIVKEDKSLLTERKNPPVHKVEKLGVKEIIITPKEEVVLDFGEMITGWVEINFRNKHTEEVVLKFGEMLQEGCFYRDNLRTAKAEFRIIGNTESLIRPHFTYYGFRYVKIEGMKEIRKEDFTAVRLMSDLDITGSIHTGNKKVNCLIANTLRSQKCNFLDIPTDCPQRDERMGWTGDIAAYADTASFHMYTPGFLHHYMLNLMAEQKALNGSVPFFVPRPKPKYHEGMNPFLYTDGACAWADAATIIPWTVYQHYGDKEMLETEYQSMCQWTDYVTGRTKENEKAFLWQNDEQLGDWLALDNENPHNPIGRTDRGLIASAYYYHSVCLCEKAAKELDHISDQLKWAALKENIRTAFIQEYLDEQGEIKGEKTQTAYALLLMFGLYDEEKKRVLANGLRRTLEQYNDHLSTGFIGTGLLCPALSENGMNELAYTLLLWEDYPGWLLEVDLGATTIWERWNSIGEDGKISDEGMNSLNHYAYGSIAGWLYRYVCGFRWDEENRFYISPMPDPRLKEVQGSCRTKYGEVFSSWKYEKNGSIIYHFNIPFQAEINIVLPGGQTYLLKTGEHVIRIKNS